MSPRAYRLGQRQAATEQTRAKIVAAAMTLLAAEGGFGGFSIDAVARQAGVARMTVYYQFGSKRGLLEALFDRLAERGRIAEGLPAAFGRSDARDALDGLIAAFGRFWAADRLITRRVRSLGALDPELGQAVRDRDERRRNGARIVVRRLAEEGGLSNAESLDEAAEILFTLSSFETFDSLAGATRNPEEVAPLVQRLARAALGLEDV